MFVCVWRGFVCVCVVIVVYDCVEFVDDLSGWLGKYVVVEMCDDGCEVVVCVLWWSESECYVWVELDEVEDVVVWMSVFRRIESDFS